MANEKPQIQAQAQLQSPASQPQQAKVKVIAISLAPPGHYRAGHFFQAGEPTIAEVTESELKRIKADKRLQILEGEVRNAKPEAKVLAEIAEAKQDDKILREAAKIIQDRKDRQDKASTERRKFERDR